MDPNEKLAKERYERGLQLLAQAEEEKNRGHDPNITGRAEQALKHANLKTRKLCDALELLKEMSRNNRIALSQTTADLATADRAERIEVKRNEAQEDARKAREQADKQTALNHSLYKELREAKEHSSRLASQVDKLRDDADKMRADIARLERERDQITRDRDFVEAQLDEDVRRATEAQKAQSEALLGAETAQVAAERAQREAEATAQEMEDKYSKATSSLQDAHVRMRALVEELQAATMRAEGSDASLEERDNKIAIFEKTFKRLQQESAASKRQLVVTEQTLQNVKVTLEGQNSAIIEAHDETMRQFQRVKTDLELSLTEAENSYTASSDEFSAFVKQLAELTASRHGFVKDDSGKWERMVEDMVAVERIAPAHQTMDTWTIGQPWISGTRVPVVVPDRLCLDDLLCRLFGRALMNDCRAATVMEFAELVTELSSTNSLVPVSMVIQLLDAWLKRLDTIGSSLLCALNTVVIVLQQRWRDPKLISHIADSVSRKVSMADLDVQIVAALAKMSRSDREKLLPSSQIPAEINLAKTLRQIWPSVPPGVYWPARQCGAIIGEGDDLWLFDRGHKVIWKAAKSSFRAPAESDQSLEQWYRFDGPGDKSLQLPHHEAMIIFPWIGTGH